MDNWFFYIATPVRAQNHGNSTITKSCSYRLGGCLLMSKKDLKKRDRGSFDYRTEYNTGTHLLKWFDSKCFVVGSSFAGVEYTNTVDKYDLAQKKKVKIHFPDMVSQYN